MFKNRVLSGLRPTGMVHLGHIFGALNNWKKLQDEYDCFFEVADFHALSTEYDNSKVIGSYSIENVIDWISVGIDPKKSVIFRQSKVPAHAVLNVILSMLVPLGWLQRVPTYKEQLKEIKGKDLSTIGFLGYPVLQAADILLYKGTHVPVGEDQLPHLELTREIVRKFNNIYGEVFPEPESLLTKNPKLLGLDNRKMSKSYGNFIALSDSPDEIRKKVQRMITDPERIKKTDPGHPDVCNVFSYYKLFAPDMVDNVSSECTSAKIGCVEDKKRLAERIIEFLEPIQKKRNELAKKQDTVMDILIEGEKRANKLANKTIEEVYKAVGL